MTIHFRLAEMRDVNLVADLVSSLKDELQSTEPCDIFRLRAAIKSGLTRADYDGVIVEVDGVCVGYAGLNQRYALYAYGGFLQLTELYILPEYRSTGVGSALLAEIEDIAKHRQLSHIEINLPSEDLPDYPRTDAFYARNGYTSRKIRTSKKMS